MNLHFFLCMTSIYKQLRIHVHIRPGGISAEIISSGREDYKFLSLMILNTLEVITLLGKFVNRTVNKF